MRRMPRISVGSFASVAHPAWRRQIKNIDSELFRRFGFEARLLKKLGFLYGNISTLGLTGEKLSSQRIAVGFRLWIRCQWLWQ